MPREEEDERDATIAALRARVEELEAQNRRLTDQLAHVRGGGTGGVPLLPPTAAGRLPSSTPAAARDATGFPVSGGRTLAGSTSSPEVDVEGVCSNCGKEVPEAAMRMHRLHCLRNFKRCEHCHVPFPLAEYSAHLTAFQGSATTLMAAIAAGDVPRVAGMLQHGTPLNFVCDAVNGDTLVHIATRVRRPAVLDSLLSRGASINAGNEAGETPLHIACTMCVSADARRKYVEDVAVASPSSPPLAGDSKQAEGSGAASSPDAADAVEALLRDASAAASSHSRARIALTRSTSAGVVTPEEMVMHLVRSGCDVDARTRLGDTPLQILQRGNQVDLVVLLTSTGGSLRPSSRDGRQRPASASSLSRLVRTPRRGSDASWNADVGSLDAALDFALSDAAAAGGATPTLLPAGIATAGRRTSTAAAAGGVAGYASPPPQPHGALSSSGSGSAASTPSAAASLPLERPMSARAASFHGMSGVGASLASGPATGSLPPRPVSSSLTPATSSTSAARASTPRGYSTPFSH